MKKNLSYIVFIGIFISAFIFSAFGLPEHEKSANSLIALTADGLQNAQAKISGDVSLNFDSGNQADNLTGNINSTNWGYYVLSLLSLLEVVVRWTPTEKDNSILKIITSIFNNLFPNNRKGGGVF